MSSNDVLTIERVELIRLLVDAYINGINTAKAVMQTINPDQAQIKQAFMKQFDGKESS